MRILEIIFYLLKRNYRVTMTELATHFNVSIKTIQRDLDKLSVAGIPIISYRGKDGGVQIDKNYNITKLLLKYTDYEELILSLYIGESISDNLKKSALIDKFKIIDEERFTKVINRCKDRFVVDIFNDKFNIKSIVCKNIDKALDNKSFINVKICGNEIEVFPISYVLRSEGLCLYCYNNGYMLLLIKEISNISVLERNDDFNIISYVDNKENLHVHNEYRK